jgi:integrase/recombinase XerD
VNITDATELLVMEVLSRKLSKNTVTFYRARCLAVRRVVGDKRIDLITTTDLRQVLATSTPASSAHNYKYMARLFRFLVDEEVILKNPMGKLTRPKVEQKVVQPLTAEEVNRCYKAAKATGGRQGARDAAIFATLVSTGIRREELCSLRESEVRLKEGMMLIHGKGNKQRLVPIPNSIRVMLGHYLFHRRDSKAEGRSDYFFKGRLGAQLQPSNLTLLMGRLGRRTGIHLHPHRLRHTFATMFMANDGADILTLQAICGWSQLSQAQRYAKPSMEKMQRSMDAFSPSIE